MSDQASVLRVAAAAMRAKADAAEAESGAEVWSPDVRDSGDVWIEPPHLGLHGYTETATHIAAWHPAVAHAVADWLDLAAEQWDINFAATQSPSIGIDHPGGIHQGDPEAAAKGADYHARHALAVARVFMGGTPDTEGDA